MDTTCVLLSGTLSQTLTPPSHCRDRGFTLLPHTSDWDSGQQRWRHTPADPVHCHGPAPAAPSDSRHATRVMVRGHREPGGDCVTLEEAWVAPGAEPWAATRDAAVVVAAYNEAEALPQVLAQLLGAFPTVIVVDDGSTDQTAALAKSAGAHVVSHPTNLGQGAALATGLAYALGSTDATHIVTFDGDGQHDVRDAVTMLDLTIAGDYDVALGSRALGSVRSQPLRRGLVLAAAVRFTRLVTGLPVTDTHNGLRVLTRRTAAKLTLTHNSMAYASELEAQVATLGLRWTESPTTISYTAYSTSKGQPNLNAVNILSDLLIARLRGSR